MKGRVTSAQCQENINKIVTVAGWLHNLRNIGNIAFLVLRDAYGYIQVVVESKDDIEKLKNLQEGSIIKVTGKCVSSQAKDYDTEIIEPKVEVLVSITEPAPIEYTKDNMKIDLDTELDYASIALRNAKKRAVFKIQAGILNAFADSLRNQGFTQFVAPVLMRVPSESGADVFEVKYFDKKAYLAQSPQIYKQIMVGVYEKVFTIAKAFRAEKHNTSRHITELTQLDAEMGFIDDYTELLDVAEQVVKDILAHLDKYNKNELEILKIELPIIPKEGIPRIKVRKALEIIAKETGKSSKQEKLDLDPEDERIIGKYVKEKYNSDFVWMLNYWSNKNFYTWNNPKDESESLSFDLLCRGLEWLSGTHRIHLYDELIKRMKKQGFNLDNYRLYLQAFKYGVPSEGGFSFGLERLTKQIVGAKNIREATLFPCDLKRIAGEKL